LFVSTVPKLIKDHAPLNLNREITRLERYLDANFAELVAIAGEGRPLDDDEGEELRGQIFRSLFWFTTACAARPIRSLNQLLVTLRDIERKSDQFIRDLTRYDPKAVDMVFRYYGRRPELARFEIGNASLIPSEISLAAAFAVHEIEQQATKGRRGRPEDDLLTNFAFKAFILFQACGGKPTTTRGGRFWRFVELLRTAVIDVALAAGSSLTVESVVRKGAV